jgi:hypothetical protein
MSKRALLEKLELYNGKVIDDLSIIDESTVNIENSFNCKCRYNHKFILSNLVDWCDKCCENDFKQEIFNEIFNELIDLESNFTLMSVSKYGIGEFNCHMNHIIISDIDDLPQACKNCKNSDSKQASQDIMIWGGRNMLSSIDNGLDDESNLDDSYNNVDDESNLDDSDNNVDKLYIIHPSEDVHINKVIQLSKKLIFNI